MSLTNRPILFLNDSKESSEAALLIESLGLDYTPAPTEGPGPILVDKGASFAGLKSIKDLLKDHSRSKEATKRAFTLHDAFRPFVREQPYAFERLFEICTELIAANMYRLPVEYGPRELWMDARAHGYIHETSTGQLLVRRVRSKQKQSTGQQRTITLRLPKRNSEKK